MENIKTKNKAIIELNPDFEDVSRRWEAYWNHDMIDRPILCAVLEKPGCAMVPDAGYEDKIHGDLGEIMRNALHNASCRDWLGDSIPVFNTSLGVHEIAQYCGFDVDWGKHAGKPLKELLPIKIDKGNFWWNRAISLYRKTNEILNGRMIPTAFDFHTNLDLIMSIIGDEQLCYEVADDPVSVDLAIENSCDVFRELWNLFVNESGCDNYGYGFYIWMYSEKPTTNISCDFSALIGKKMFRRWVMPALEYESGLVGDRSVYHWDGPGALKHMEDLASIKNIHTLSYVPSPFTRHHQFLDIYQECQRKGKCVTFGGSPDEIMSAHKLLKPSMTCYLAEVNNREEFYALEKWLKNNI